MHCQLQEGLYADILVSGIKSIGQNHSIVKRKATEIAISATNLCVDAVETRRNSGQDSG
jgi:hypothetical protein